MQKMWMLLVLKAAVSRRDMEFARWYSRRVLCQIDDEALAWRIGSK